MNRSVVKAQADINPAIVSIEASLIVIIYWEQLICAV